MNAEELIESITEPSTKLNVLERYLSDVPDKMLDFSIKVIICILFIVVCRFLILFLLKLIKHSMEKAGAEKSVITFIHSFCKAILYFLVICFVLTAFGVSTASVVAVLGSAAVAIGLALQGSLSNLAGGVLILLLRPFKVGDYIYENGYGNEGTVTEIQIFYTKLLTVDNKVVVLPNGDLANKAITNFSAMPFRRIEVKVSIAYHEDLKAVKQILQNVLEEDPLLLKDKEHLVYVEALGDSAVEMVLRGFVSSEDYWQGQWRIREAVKTALEDAHISIPFPQLDVQIKNQNA